MIRLPRSGGKVIPHAVVRLLQHADQTERLELGGATGPPAGDGPGAQPAQRPEPSLSRLLAPQIARSPYHLDIDALIGTEGLM